MGCGCFYKLSTPCTAIAKIPVLDNNNMDVQTVHHRWINLKPLFMLTVHVQHELDSVAYTHNQEAWSGLSPSRTPVIETIGSEIRPS